MRGLSPKLSYLQWFLVPCFLLETTLLQVLIEELRHLAEKVLPVLATQSM